MELPPMHSFIDHLSEAKKQGTIAQRMAKEYKGGKGDCFQAAFNWALALDVEDYDKAKLCQGMVHGQGPLEGKKFSHAWCEMEGTVYDYSNRRQVEMPKPVYYHLGRINESTVFKYPIAKSFGKAAKARHYGPWDFKGDTEDVPGYGADVSEEIPDETREIGKRKVQIPRKLLLSLKMM